MPDVSIILPTYNRADVLLRAVASIQAQTHTDWELLIVDDGSTDDTLHRLADIPDARIRILPQTNQGAYVARNTGLLASRGRHITFMDSDDEWLPHFLELTTAFLDSHPEAGWVSTEFLEDRDDGQPLIRHDLHDIAAHYAPMARRLGSAALALPPGATDDYLRVYRQREPLGDWGADIVRRLGAQPAWIYHGDIGEAMRWGYLNWLPVTVITRAALDQVGLFATRTRSAADFQFLVRLARQFEAHMIAVPGAIKHDRAGSGLRLAQDHLATGQGSHHFNVNFLGYFDELFCRQAPHDAELQRLHRHLCLGTGHGALTLGLRREAAHWLAQAAAWEPGLWQAWPMALLARLWPHDRGAARLYLAWLQLCTRVGALGAGWRTLRSAAPPVAAASSAPSPAP